MQSKDDEIRKYWDRKAMELGTDPSATMKDTVLRSMEIEAIASRLRKDDRLLDVGCGNAHGSLAFAEHCQSVLAADYSSEMVAAAQRAIKEKGQANISALQASILELGDLQLGTFTAASCVRCLINLGSSQRQQQAVRHLARVLPSGGRLFLIEGIEENFGSLNSLRERMGLSPITLNWHNVLPKREELNNWLHEAFEIEEIVDFGEYYFLSRIVHPLLVAPDEPKFQAPMNHLARAIWRNDVAQKRFSDLSVLVLYCCRKR